MFLVRPFQLPRVSNGRCSERAASPRARRTSSTSEVVGGGQGIRRVSGYDVVRIYLARCTGLSPPGGRRSSSVRRRPGRGWMGEMLRDFLWGSHTRDARARRYPEQESGCRRRSAPLAQDGIGTDDVPMLRSQGSSLVPSKPGAATGSVCRLQRTTTARIRPRRRPRHLPLPCALAFTPQFGKLTTERWWAMRPLLLGARPDAGVFLVPDFAGVLAVLSLTGSSHRSRHHR